MLRNYYVSLEWNGGGLTKKPLGKPGKEKRHPEERERWTTVGRTALGVGTGEYVRGLNLSFCNKEGGKRGLKKKTSGYKGGKETTVVMKVKRIPSPAPEWGVSKCISIEPEGVEFVSPRLCERKQTAERGSKNDVYIELSGRRRRWENLKTGRSPNFRIQQIRGVTDTQSTRGAPQ